VQLAEGDPTAALDSFRKGLAAIERAANIDPNNAGWQRDVAISYGKLAAALKQTGDNEQALDALRRGQAIIERMANLFPDNATWKQDLAWIAARIAEIAPTTPQ